MKMQNLIKTTLFAAVLVGSSAFAATSADGSPADGSRESRKIAVTSQAKYFNVFHGDIVRFTLADGSQFSWKFDGTSNYVNLVDIAPKGTINQDVRVYVQHFNTSDNR